MKHTNKLSFDEYLNDIVLQKALIRSLEVIGEAIKNINFSFLEKYPLIQWREIAGMRDKLIYHYFDVDDDMVYKTCRQDVPDLLHDIRLIISAEKSGD